MTLFEEMEKNEKIYKNKRYYYKKFLEAKRQSSEIKYPEWIVKRYLILKRRFGDNPTTTKEISEKLDIKGVRSLISEMKKHGLVIVHQNEKDKRIKNVIIR